MQHFLIALALFLAILFFVLFPHKPPPAVVATPQPVWTAAEKDYYRQIFSYTMENIGPGNRYEWASYSGKGIIVPQAAFVSKSGATCRNYVETFVTRGQTTSESGISCRRAGNDGWCRLKEGNALTCAMETISGAGGVQMGSGNVSGGTSTDVHIDADINMPSGNSATSPPNVNRAPEVKPTVKKGANDVADTVTGNAGSAAGTVAGTSIKWFTEIFR